MSTATVDIAARVYRPDDRLLIELAKTDGDLVVPKRRRRRDKDRSL